jgi:hypothetical protein
MIVAMNQNKIVTLSSGCILIERDGATANVTSNAEIVTVLQCSPQRRVSRKRLARRS